MSREKDTAFSRSRADLRSQDHHPKKATFLSEKFDFLYCIKYAHCLFPHSPSSRSLHTQIRNEQKLYPIPHIEIKHQQRLL